MEERKTIVDYMEQVMKIFGFTIITLNVFCLLFGESAEDFSSIFSLGKEGLSIATMMQFLLLAVWIVFMRFLFFTDIVIKNMRVVFRAGCMIISILAVMIACVPAFDWFPVDDWLPWMMFLISFGICFVISLVITSLKERIENKKMEEALERLKRKEG